MIISRRVSSPIRVHLRVVHALVLRDIKTRAGASYFGFLFGLVMPLGHIGLLLSIYVFWGRRPAIGTDTVLFLASAMLPFIVWSYTHQKMILAFSQNKPLMSFSIVGFTAIALARAIVEILTATLVVLVTATLIWISGSEMFFSNIKMIVASILLAYCFGVSTGFLFGILSLVSTVLTMAGFLLVPLFWVTCGGFFIPDAIPEIARAAASIFVVTHIVDLTRMAVYSGYVSSFSNVYYVIFVTLSNLLLALILSKVMQVSLTSR